MTAGPPQAQPHRAAAGPSSGAGSVAGRHRGGGQLAQLERSVRAGGRSPARAAVTRAALPPTTSVRRSAVLALGSDTATPDIVLTRRNAHLNHHAGQVSLPGGRADPQDADIVATALREAQEEVGLQPSAANVIGTLPATLIAVSSSNVTTVVASWDGAAPLGIVDPGEVAAIRRVAMSELADPAHRARAHHPSGFRGPAFLLEDLFVWGFTAQLLDEILDAGGWSQPWDRHRVVDIPTEYLGRSLNS